MRIKHIFWVVSSQFIDTAELNELLINAERRKNRTIRTLHQKVSCVKNTTHVCWIGCTLWLSCIPWVSKFLLFLDVAVCVKISMELPLIQLVDLVLLQNKQTNGGRQVNAHCKMMNTSALTQLPPHSVFGRPH